MIRRLALTAAVLTSLASALYGSSGGIQGTVRYRGEGVPGAYVEAFTRANPDGQAVTATNTGADGRFRLTLPPGSYLVTVKKRPEGPGSGGMLFGSSGDDPVRVEQGTVTLPPLVMRDLGGSGEISGGQVPVSGAVHGEGGPLSGAYVYFYPEGFARGPGYLARVRSGEKGLFTAGLAPGSYTVTVRYGPSGDGMGSVGVQDLVGSFSGNPLAVGKDPVRLGRIEVRPVDPVAWEKRHWAASSGPLSVVGTILREDGSPVAGAYAFLYEDHRMVGKPLAISSPTGTDGTYSLAVSRPGTYYLGARTRFGGPVEPGEFMGAWDDKGPRPLSLEGNVPSTRCDIVVREVW